MLAVFKVSAHQAMCIFDVVVVALDSANEKIADADRTSPSAIRMLSAMASSWASSVDLKHARKKTSAKPAL